MTWVRECHELPSILRWVVGWVLGKAGGGGQKNETRIGKLKCKKEGAGGRY